MPHLSSVEILFEARLDVRCADYAVEDPPLASGSLSVLEMDKRFQCKAHDEILLKNK